MLTRLEAHGFKNLLDFAIDFGPFTCIAGPNAVGKSNVFDAIRFLSLLTDHTIMDAALQIRGSDPDTTSIEELFWTDGANRADEFTLAVEMIVDRNVVDDFGRPAEPTSTFLRYEIEIAHEPADSVMRLGGLRLKAERLSYITESEAAHHLRFPHAAGRFRSEAVTNRRRSKVGYISTEEALDGQTEILVHQDGGSRGKPQKAPAATAPKTIVGTSNTSATPTILAARREMQSWNILALEPSAMRRADRYHTDPNITSNGEHLPATLNRLTAGRGGSRVLAEVASRLSELVAVRSVDVNRDDTRQLLTLTVGELDSNVLPARSLSDGTLRFLTLAVIEQDTEANGVLCMEEPENGIHPEKMGAMVSLLYDLAVDASDSPGSDNPMRQLLVATHAPLMVQLVRPDDVLCAVGATVRGPGGTETKTLRCRPLTGTWRARRGEHAVGKGSLIAYLTTPPGAQISLDGAELT